MLMLPYTISRFCAVSCSANYGYISFRLVRGIRNNEFTILFTLHSGFNLEIIPIMHEPSLFESRQIRLLSNINGFVSVKRIYFQLIAIMSKCTRRMCKHTRKCCQFDSGHTARCTVAHYRHDLLTAPQLVFFDKLRENKLGSGAVYLNLSPSAPWSVEDSIAITVHKVEVKCFTIYFGTSIV